MKHPRSLSHLHVALRTVLAAVAVGGLSVNVARASSYASNLTNDNGTVSFRLNEDADNVTIIGNGNTLTNHLGPATRGLVVTNLTGLGMTAGAFKVMVAKIGTGGPSTNGPSLAFNSPRGVAVNVNPATPNFGRVYVANSAGA